MDRFDKNRGAEIECEQEMRKKGSLVNTREQFRILNKAKISPRD